MRLTISLILSWVLAASIVDVDTCNGFSFVPTTKSELLRHGRAPSQLIHLTSNRQHQNRQKLHGHILNNSDTCLKLSPTRLPHNNDDHPSTPLPRPSSPSSCQVVIEYCTGCRWMMKSFWYAQELLTTFAKTDGLDAITILPSTKDQTGIFIMRLLKMTTTSFTEDDDDTVTSNEMILWDRKAESGFPQPKEIKQQIRDVIDPDKYLGHSDTEQRKVEMTNEVIDLTSSTPTTLTSVGGPLKLHLPNAPTPSVTITYCTGCQWLLRAAYLGQELLSTFGDGQIASITLVPSRPPAKGGQFTVELDNAMLFDRSVAGRFPEVKEIKQLIRDRIAPDMNLGHSDTDDSKKRKTDKETISSSESDSDDEDDTSGLDDLDDDEAMEARKYFGVM